MSESSVPASSSVGAGPPRCARLENSETAEGEKVKLKGDRRCQPFKAHTCFVLFLPWPEGEARGCAGNSIGAEERGLKEASHGALAQVSGSTLLRFPCVPSYLPPLPQA